MRVRRAAEEARVVAAEIAKNVTLLHAMTASASESVAHPQEGVAQTAAAQDAQAAITNLEESEDRIDQVEIKTIMIRERQGQQNTLRQGHLLTTLTDSN